MQNISTWVSAMRLRTLPLSIAGIVVSACLAHYNGFFEWDIFVLAVITTLSFQILSNLANDYGDGIKGTDNEDRIGPERAIQSGQISPEELMNAIKINIMVSIILAFLLIFSAFGVKHFLLTVLFFLLGFLSISAAISYTVGDKAYGYRGLGDLFVFIFFGLLSVIGSYVLFAKEFHHVTFLPAITIGLLSTAVLNLNNMRDRLSDEKSNKITLAVKLGENKIRIYHNVLVLGAIIVSLLFGILYYTSPYNLIYFVAYIPLLLHLKRVNGNIDPKLFDPELKKLALTTVLLSILMGLGHLLPF
ncbi:1,4-dihydroxy-2-naphthoate octaprenyltransferase [Algibacter luteus]|uniref:1,4-dihydroxy-2-naphthoate octaprenyltransferase n=1 Tax=Algibacter luteus TaxID=1178825 RepID=UPI002595295E|nr:1,4-dihydroxy-2-naphthoate octaprenyltransferase [Algibacter luteus]WJJ95577.1 1,4-dihydroxy-2-naphthoate octaprenyltransferase [Algibacter luteus]